MDEIKEETVSTTDTKKKRPEFKIIGDPIVIGKRGQSGWTLELNKIQWDPANPEIKYDIRTWAPEHKKIGKGISLNKEELVALRDALNSFEL